MKRKGRRDAKLPEEPMAPTLHRILTNRQPLTANCQLATLAPVSGWEHFLKE